MEQIAHIEQIEQQQKNITNRTSIRKTNIGIEKKEQIEHIEQID